MAQKLQIPILVERELKNKGKGYIFEGQLSAKPGKMGKVEDINLQTGNLGR